MTRVASNLMVSCGQLDAISQLVHLVLQVQQSQSLAGESIRLVIMTDAFTATVTRNQLSQGTQIDLGNGQTVTIPPESMAAYAAQLEQTTSENIDTSAARPPIEMDTRILTFAREWSTCRGPGTISAIQSIELTFPDGRPVNITRLPSGILPGLTLLPNQTDDVLAKARGQLCPSHLGAFNETAVANAHFRCTLLGPLPPALLRPGMRESRRPTAQRSGRRVDLDVPVHSPDRVRRHLVVSRGRP